MITRLKILFFTISNGLLLIFLLCLGAQNLRDRHKINIGISSTPPYPSGFLIGTSISLGFISGGSAAALIISQENNQN